MTGRVWPGAFSRARRNALLRAWAGREWELRQRQPQVVLEARAAREAGDPDRAVLFIGQDAGLIDSLEPAAELVARIVREACEIITTRLPGLVTRE